MGETEKNGQAGRNRATVLVVDDSRTVLLHVEALLKDHYRVLTALSGEVALGLANAQPRPDVILLDVVMPVMDGYEVLRRLRASEGTRDIPVIFVTAKGADEDEALGLALGAVDYMTKPLRPAILLARLSNHLELKRSRDLLRNQNASLESLMMERTKTLHAILNCADQIIAMILPDGTIMAINRIGAKQFDATPSGLMGRNFFELLPPDLAEKLRTSAARVVQEGEQQEIDDTRDDRTLHATIFPVAGEPPRVVIYANDVSNYVQSEALLRQEQARLSTALSYQQELNQKLEEAQNQLLQSEKMASLGQLAAGVAHELNNPIGFVHSNLGTLEGYLRDIFDITKAWDQAAQQVGNPAAFAVVEALKKEKDFAYISQDIFQLMAESKEGLARVRKIVQDLKDFSRVGEVDWQWADIHAGLESTLNIVWNELKYKCTVVKHFDPDLPQILCLPSQLNQVFMNLLVNAAHAIETKGVITITTERVGEDAIRIRIGDTGSGIPQENLTRIFDPFFTTKAVGKGTGLGLSIAYGIVTKHQGQIEVESTLGQGSTFTITLPVESPAASAGGEVAPA